MRYSNSLHLIDIASNVIIQVLSKCTHDFGATLSRLAADRYSQTEIFTRLAGCPVREQI